MARNLEVLSARLRDWHRRHSYEPGTMAPGPTLGQELAAVLSDVIATCEARGIDIHQELETLMESPPLLQGPAEPEPEPPEPEPPETDPDD